ncbi:hypothetical protein PIB30_106359, partial [Stylosanthes scabra]|nr:hypothetical protein [Stylosanthes scabra]
MVNAFNRRFYSVARKVTPYMELAATKRGANLLRPTWLGGGSEREESLELRKFGENMESVTLLG